MLVLLGLAAAFLLAVGYVVQQHEAAELPGDRFRPELLLVLARRPVWLVGIGAMIAGQVLGALALGMGSLVVVEPLLATNVMFALPLAALASQRRLSAGDWGGAVLQVGGLALFLFGIGRRTEVNPRGLRPLTWVVLAAALLVVTVTLLLVARRRTARPRAALLGTAAGVLFGAQDFLTQRALVRLDRGVLALLASWPPWVLIGVAVVALTFAQRAFGLADLSASLPAITLAEPVCGIALSMGTLGQRLPLRPLLLACVAVGLVLMVTSVVILTRSPLVVDPHGTRHPFPRLPGSSGGR